MHAQEPKLYVHCEDMFVLLLLGYEKLKPYGIYFHGCIDGGSNFVVYAIAALDKSSSTLLKAFDEAVDTFGYPLRLRADMCFEATAVGQRMLDEQGPGSYITGPSTANQVYHCSSQLLCVCSRGLHMASVLPCIVMRQDEQRSQYRHSVHCNSHLFAHIGNVLQRIENWWNFAWRAIASYYKGLFQNLEQMGLLDRYICHAKLVVCCPFAFTACCCVMQVQSQSSFFFGCCVSTSDSNPPGRNIHRLVSL